MQQELLILRHAKSSWNDDTVSDFDRPLNKRGMRDAPRIGAWMRDQGLRPELILCSPAARARATLAAINEVLEVPESQIQLHDAIYEANRSTLLDLLRKVPANVHRAMMIGHNPGLETLTEYLSDRPLEPGFMKTATLARLLLKSPWEDLAQSSAVLESLMTPKQLPGDPEDD